MSVCLLLGLLLPSTLAAQGDSTAKPTLGPPVRRIATASAVSTEQIGSITSVRELPGGRVLLNDGARRRLLVMDTTLKTLEVVLDSLTEVENSYGTRPGSMIPYRADSTGDRECDLRRDWCSSASGAVHAGSRAGRVAGVEGLTGL